MTLIGVPRETATGECRVALVPKVVERLSAAGLSVIVEAGAGGAALIPDQHYEEVGATIADPWPADVVVKVNPPTADENVAALLIAVGDDRMPPRAHSGHGLRSASWV